MSLTEDKVAKVNAEKAEARAEAEKEAKKAARKERIEETKEKIQKVIEKINVVKKIKNEVDKKISDIQAAKAIKEVEKAKEAQEQQEMKESYEDYLKLAESSLDKVGTIETVKDDKWDKVEIVYTEYGPIIHGYEESYHGYTEFFKGFAPKGDDKHAPLEYTELTHNHDEEFDMGSMGTHFGSESIRGVARDSRTGKFERFFEMVGEGMAFESDNGKRYSSMKKRFKDAKDKALGVQQESNSVGPSLE